MKLTKKERELLPLLCLPYKDICKKLYISEGTLKSHITNLLFKFPEQKNKQSIVIEAVKQGIITLDEVVTK